MATLPRSSRQIRRWRLGLGSKFAAFAYLFGEIARGVALSDQSALARWTSRPFDRRGVEASPDHVISDLNEPARKLSYLLCQHNHSVRGPSYFEVPGQPGQAAVAGHERGTPITRDDDCRSSSNKEHEVRPASVLHG